MDYKVGSLADLISGSSTHKSKNAGFGYKIEFQNEDSISENHQRKKRSNSDVFDATQKRKRKKIGKPFHDERETSNAFTTSSVDNNYNYTCNEETSDVHSSAPAVNFTNAQKRLRKKEKKGKVVKSQQFFDEEKESRTIFVKNLPITLKKSKIKKMFEKYGTVQSIRFRCVALSDPRIPKKVAVIKGKFHPGRSNISAYVCFESSQSAVQALAANGTVVADHHILVDKAIQENAHDQRKAVFVGNVPFAAEEDDLWKLFESCGNISDIRIIRDRNTGIGKGFAYINFESSDAVELALKYNGEKLKERELRVSRASKKQKIEGRKGSVKSNSENYYKSNQRFERKKDKHAARRELSKVVAGEKEKSVELSHENHKEKNKKIKKNKLYENNSGEIKNNKSNMTSQVNDFQGHTILDKKKQKKKKKKLNKVELKRKIVIKKLGIKTKT